MNGTGKWLLGVASALIVGLIGWSLHTTQVHDVELAGQKAEMESAIKEIAKLESDMEETNKLLRQIELEMRRPQ